MIRTSSGVAADATRAAAASLAGWSIASPESVHSFRISRTSSRVDAPASREEKAVLGRLAPEQVTATSLAGEPITAKLTTAPGNGAAIGGLKVTTESGWFAARPSGTEDVYKIYAESFRGPDHLKLIQQDARAAIAKAF